MYEIDQGLLMLDTLPEYYAASAFLLSGNPLKQEFVCYN